MKNLLTTIGEDGHKTTIEILLSFDIEELNKKYVAYTLNDDGISENVNVFISEIEYINEKPVLKSIKEKEKEMVLLFYNNIKTSI